MLPAYGPFEAATAFDAIEDQVRRWLTGPRPRYRPLVDIDDTIFLPDVPYEIQQALNMADRLRAVAPSPDLWMQFLGEGNIPAHHSPNNVRPVPTAYNKAKFNQLDEVALLHLLAFVEVENGRDPRRLVTALCRLAELNRASATAKNLAADVRERSNARYSAFRRWLEDGEEPPPHRFGLPEPDIHEATDAYQCGPPQIEHLDRICDQLAGEPIPTHQHVQTNEDDVCTLWFDARTPTADLAGFLIGAIKRMMFKCGSDFPWFEDDNEIKLYRFWVQVVVDQGYIRRPGLTGLLDPATQLPMIVGAGPHHPLAASLAAHAEHGMPLTLHPPNLAVESWFWNRFRGRYRPGSLLATVNAILPTLQVLRDHLFDRGVLLSSEILAPVGFSARFAQAYGRNYVHPIEHACMDNRRPERLQAALDRFRCPATNEWAASCLCAGCKKKRRVVTMARTAHRIVHG